MVTSLINAMSNSTKFIVSLFTQFVSLPCEHQIPCKDCKSCWQKICTELHKEDNIDHEIGMAVKL